MLDHFKVHGESVRDPYDFTILPCLVPNNDVFELIESAKELRMKSKEFAFGVSDAKLKLINARIKAYEADMKLAAVKAQLASYTSSA